MVLLRTNDLRRCRPSGDLPADTYLFMLLLRTNDLRRCRPSGDLRVRAGAWAGKHDATRGDAGRRPPCLRLGVCRPAAMPGRRNPSMRASVCRRGDRAGFTDMRGVRARARVRACARVRARDV